MNLPASSFIAAFRAPSAVGRHRRRGDAVIVAHRAAARKAHPAQGARGHARGLRLPVSFPRTRESGVGAAFRTPSSRQGGGAPHYSLYPPPPFA